MICYELMIIIIILVAGICFLLGSVFALNGRLDYAEENKELIEDIDACCFLVEQMLADLPDDKRAKYIEDIENGKNFEVRV